MPLAERVQAGRDPGGDPLHRPAAGPAGRADHRDVGIIIVGVVLPHLSGLGALQGGGGLQLCGEGEHGPGPAAGAAEAAAEAEEEEERVAAVLLRCRRSRIGRAFVDCDMDLTTSPLPASPSAAAAQRFLRRKRRSLLLSLSLLDYDHSVVARAAFFYPNFCDTKVCAASPLQDSENEPKRKTQRIHPPPKPSAISARKLPRPVTSRQDEAENCALPPLQKCTLLLLPPPPTPPLQLQLQLQQDFFIIPSTH